MTQLSSCYFCGIALETPVRPFALPTVESGGRVTVSLCTSCREKLDVVLDTMGTDSLSAVDGGSPEEEDISTEVHERTVEEDSLEEVVEEECSEGSDDELVEEFDAELDADETEADEMDTAEAADEMGTAGTVEETGGEDFGEEIVGDELDDPFEEEGVLPENDPLAGDTTDSLKSDAHAESLDDEPTGADQFVDIEEDDSTEEATESDQEEGTTHDQAAVEGDETGDTDVEDVDEGGSLEDDTGGESTVEGTDEEESEEATAATRVDGEGESESGATAQSKTTISALEYNRVMRMLQNREFPVDRGEIEVVAANAYDLAQSECAQVIDLAVDRGLLDERDGELYRPQD